ncbi:MAG: glutathione peroxidase [Clostridia bacterium]|nr:glutathione peroxidase [Clostridia bacterium]
MSIYDFSVKTRKGEDFELSAYEGKVMLIVNTATGCGFTPQYEGLEEMYEKYHEKGLEILDFPCNQFKGQAPGSDEEIHEFCTLKYNTQFDQFKKIDVNGENEAPLYTFLKEQAPAEEVSGIKNKLAMKAISKLSDSTQKESDIKWNFTKFLVDRSGKVIARYTPTTAPKEIEKDIVKII